MAAEAEHPVTGARSNRQRHGYVLAACLAVVVLAGVLDVRADGRVAVQGFSAHALPPVCMSQRALGVKCPGCGLTRSFVHLAHGRWDAARAAHRLGWLVFLAVLVQVPYRFVAMYRARPPLRGRWWRLGSAWALLVLLIGNWAIEMLA